MTESIPQIIPTQITKVDDTKFSTKANILTTLLTIVPDRECVEIRGQPYDKPFWWSGYYDAAHLPKMATDATVMNATSKGIYVVLNSINPSLLARRTNRIDTFGIRNGDLTSDSDIIKWDYIPIDIDPKRPSGISSTQEELDSAYAVSEQVMEYLKSVGFSEPIIAFSGNGWHLLYKIDLPRSTENDKVVKNVLYSLSKKFDNDKAGVDISNSNPSRIFKLYGTKARKGTHTTERPHRESYIRTAPDEVKTTPIEVIRKIEGYGSATGNSKRTLNKIANPKNVTARHPEFMKIIGNMVRKGEDHDTIVQAVVEYNSKLTHPKTDDILLPEIEKGIAYSVSQKDNSSDDTDDSGKIEVNVSKFAHTLTEHTNICLSAITSVFNNPNKRIFIRGGVLSNVSYDEKNNVVIKSMEMENVMCVLDQCCKFVTYKEISEKDGGGFEMLKARPLKDVAINILASSNLHEVLPPLNGIVESPYITTDGYVVTQPGYNDKTGLFFAATEDYKGISVPDFPSQQEVSDATEHLSDIFHDFQFEDMASRDNAFAAILTAVLRPAINGCTPMYMVDKPQMGTGGSLICEIITRIATGKPLQSINAPKDNNADEWEKRIGSILLSGTPMVCFDNIESNFHSSSLASVITSEKYSARILGSSNHTVLDVRTNWLGNGINLNIQGDMPRRIYLTRIVTDMARPQLKTGFKIPDIAEHTITHRYEYIKDILIIARAYHVAGCPKPEWIDASMKVHSIPRIASFLKWIDLIGGIMVFVGKKDFLGNVETVLQDCESQGDDSEILLDALNKFYNGKEFVASEIVRYPEWLDLLPSYISAESTPSSKAKKLGRYFLKIKGRVHQNGCRIKVSRVVMHVQRWVVEYVEQKPQTTF